MESWNKLDSFRPFSQKYSVLNPISQVHHGPFAVGFQDEFCNGIIVREIHQGSCRKEYIHQSQAMRGEGTKEGAPGGRTAWKETLQADAERRETAMPEEATWEGMSRCSRPLKV